MPILCEPATSSGRLLYTIGGDVHAVDSLTEAARLLDRDPTEFLVVIGPRAPTNEALAFAASLRMSRPSVGVILTRHEVDVALLTSALQSGVREVVRAGDDAALAAACRRSYEVSRRMVAETPAVPVAPAAALVPEIPAFVYALGRIDARYPTLAVEKELALLFGGPGSDHLDSNRTVDVLQ